MVMASKLRCFFRLSGAATSPQSKSLAPEAGMRRSYSYLIASAVLLVDRWRGRGGARGGWL